MLLVIDLTGSFSLAQERKSVKISLDSMVQDDQFLKSMAIVPVYKYKGNVIEPYTMFGVDPPKNQQDLVVKKMPDMQGMHDTAYSFLYFSGADNSVNQGYLLMILGNYRRSVRTIFFFVDRNNNLDFTDDGPPDSLGFRDWDLQIELKNQIFPEGRYTAKLTRLEYGENVTYKNMLTEHYKKHSGRKEFTDINYCFREQRYNTRAGDFVSGSDSFRIALKDLNTNGLFNEPCIDKMYVGPHGRTVTIEQMFYIVPNIKATTFEWNKRKYQLVNASVSGSFIEIRQMPSSDMTNRLEKGKKIPAFTYKDTRKNDKNIRTLKNKPIYVFFWDKAKITTSDTLYLSKMVREFADDIHIITLNHGDEPKMVLIMEYYDRIIWPIGFSTKKIATKYFLEEVPRGYLADKKKRLINDQIRPEEVYYWLLKNKK
jgi:hypothetical protein